MDPDPIRAVQILQTTPTGRNAIHGMGHNPFYVTYNTTHQLNVYKKLLKLGHLALYIDASGVHVPKLRRPDGTFSHSIFVYHGVVNSDAGHFSVTQFLSEAHSSTYIRFWLMNLGMIGAPRPKEVVIDRSRALTTAVVKEFTRYFTIEEYADACRDVVPRCFVRHDVAHFIKDYATDLTKCSKPVRTFYLAAIGQLILCRELEDAAKIMKALLVVMQCETEGPVKATKQRSECEDQLSVLEKMITGKNKL